MGPESGELVNLSHLDGPYVKEKSRHRQIKIFGVFGLDKVIYYSGVFFSRPRFGPQNGPCRFSLPGNTPTRLPTFNFNPALSDARAGFRQPIKSASGSTTTSFWRWIFLWMPFLIICFRDS